MPARDALSPELVLRGYCAGIFPMADERGKIEWFSPDPRCIFELDRLRISRSLRQTVRRGTFQIRFDTAFEDVMRCCAEREEGTWISDRILQVYVALHQAGFAHSVESWAPDAHGGSQLVGGLYGVAIGGAFFGESMFHRRADASKVALVALVERLRARGYTLLDTQWITPHLASLGASEIPRAEYLSRLDAAVALRCAFGEPRVPAEPDGLPADS